MSGTPITEHDGIMTVAVGGLLAVPDGLNTLLEAVRGLRRQPVRAVVLRWDRSHDLSSDVTGDAAGDGPRVIPEESGVVLRELLRERETLSIAVASRAVDGAGLALMLACDLRLAIDGTTFAVTDGAGHGLAPLLLGIVGRATTVRLLLGDTLGMQAARAAGLIDAEVASGDAGTDHVGVRLAALLAGIATPEDGRRIARALRAAEELPVVEAAEFTASLRRPLPEEDRVE